MLYRGTEKLNNVLMFTQTLGFKSRSNFISTFKKVIGLTPTEYMKMAKDRQADYTPYEEIENKE